VNLATFLNNYATKDSHIEELLSQKGDWCYLISDEEKAEIEEGIQQADRGELKSTDENSFKIQKMALKVTWTPRAEQGYNKIIKYLESKWTDREIINFIIETKKFLTLLEKNPYLFRTFGKQEKCVLEDH
jgi:predicted transcriptional regulator